MINRTIQSFSAYFPDPADQKEDMAALTADLNKRAARRMSTLGKLLWAVLRDQPVDPATTIIYGTTYTEANALESYLDSFPYASPTAFQTSIHPGGLEQALILDKRAAGPIFPLAGGKDLFARMLVTAFSCGAPEVLVCGGEEMGNWLADFGLAAPRSFAFSMRLGSEPDNRGLGSIQWDPQPGGPASDGLPEYMDCLQLLADRRSLSINAPSSGTFRIEWSGVPQEQHRPIPDRDGATRPLRSLSVSCPHSSPALSSGSAPGSACPSCRNSGATAVTIGGP